MQRTPWAIARLPLRVPGSWDGFWLKVWIVTVDPNGMSVHTSPSERRSPVGLLGARRVLGALYRRWSVPLRIGAYGFCLAAGPFLLASFLLSAFHIGNFMVDFKYAFSPAGHALSLIHI